MGIGGESGGDIYVDLLPGYDFDAKLSAGDLITKREPHGMHGFNPRRASMRTLMVLNGPGIQAGQRLSGESGSLVKIANDHTHLEVETGLTISIKTPATRKPAESFLPYQLTASCMDHPGIVYRLSGVLSSLGINIESMETKTYAAPVSGTPIFRLEADISVPTKTNINALRERFAAIQKEENIDIELSLVHGGAT